LVDTILDSAVTGLTPELRSVVEILIVGDVIMVEE